MNLYRFFGTKLIANHRYIYQMPEIKSFHLSFSRLHLEALNVKNKAAFDRKYFTAKDKLPSLILVFPQEFIPNHVNYALWTPLKEKMQHSQRLKVHLQKKMENSSKHPLMNFKEGAQIFQCQNVEQLLQLFTMLHSSQNGKLFANLQIYQAFVKKAYELDHSSMDSDGEGYKFIWNLFNCLRYSLVSNDRRTSYYPYANDALITVYSTFMNAAVNETGNGRISCKRAFGLLKNLKRICMDDSTPYPEKLYANSEIYTHVIRSCSRWKSPATTNKLNNVLDELFDIHAEGTKFWKYDQLWGSILNFYVQIDDLETMMKYYQIMLKHFDCKLQKGGESFARAIAPFASKTTITKADVEIAEQIFIDSCLCLKRYDQHSWGALMNVYAAIGDLYSCMAMMNAEITKVNILGIENVDCSSIPPLTNISIGMVLKCLQFEESIFESIHENQNTESDILGWQVIDYLYEQMENIEIMSNYNKISLYRMFFDICGVSNSVTKPNITKLKRFYNDMTQIYGYKPDNILLNFIRSGLSFYRWELKNINDNELEEETIKERNSFIEFCMQELKKYNIKSDDEIYRLLINNECETHATVQQSTD